MNTSLSVDLLLYGVMLFGLSVLAHNLSPHGFAMTIWIGIAGGAISVILGGLGLRGYPVRRWAIVAMAILSIVLLAQTGFSWLAVKADVDAPKSVALILTLLSAMAVGQLVNLIQNRSGLLSSADREDGDSDERRK